MQWDSDEALDRLALTLTGPALSFFENLPQQTKDSYQGATAALQRRFGKVLSISGHRMKFQNLTQSDSENFIQFADRIRSEAQEAYPDMDHLFVEMEMVRRFLLGCVAKEAAMATLSKEPTTLDTAVDALQLYIENQRALLKTKRTATAMRTRGSSTTLQREESVAEDSVCAIKIPSVTPVLELSSQAQTVQKMQKDIESLKESLNLVLLQLSKNSDI